MKKLILMIFVLLLVLSAGCAKKKDSAKKPSPTPTPDVTKSDAVKSDAAEDDVTPSSDVSVSSDVQESDETEELSLEGSWQSKDKTFTISFMTDEGVALYIADKVNMLSSYTYEDGIIKLLRSGSEYTVVSQTDKKLVLQSGDDKITLRKLSTKKGAEDFAQETLFGRWICHIDNGGKVVQFEITFRDDMTADYVMNLNGKEEKLEGVTWRVTKKGMLILDNGTGSSKSQLKYRILGAADDDTLFIVMENQVLCIYRAD